MRGELVVLVWICGAAFAASRVNGALRLRRLRTCPTPPNARIAAMALLRDGSEGMHQAAASTGSGAELS